MQKFQTVPHQRGSVLLSVLVILMLASLIVMSLQKQQTYDTRHTGQFIRSVQAWHYALGAEAYSKQLLFEAFDPKILIDYPGQQWAKPRPAFTLPQGILSLQVEDLQARFNLNSLAQKDTRYSKLLNQLLQQTGMDKDLIPPFLATLKTLADAGNAIAIAQGTMPSPSTTTTSSNPGAVPDCDGVPFLTDASQLMDLGLSVDIYKKIAPYITVLPTTCSNFNINTITGLLETIVAGSDDKVASIAKLRKQPGYLTTTDINTLGLGITVVPNSNFFSAHIVIKDDYGTYGLSSVIERSLNENNQVIMSTILRNWQRCPECYP